MFCAVRYVCLVLWALGMLVLGMMLWVEVHPVSGMVLIAAGQILLMSQVADPLLPIRKQWMTSFIETTTIALLVLTLAAVSTLAWMHVNQLFFF